MVRERPSAATRPPLHKDEFYFSGSNGVHVDVQWYGSHGTAKAIHSTIIEAVVDGDIISIVNEIEARLRRGITSFNVTMTREDVDSPDEHFSSTIWFVMRAQQ